MQPITANHTRRHSRQLPVWLLRAGALAVTVALLALATPVIWAAVSAGLGLVALASMAALGVALFQAVPLGLQRLENHLLKRRKAQARGESDEAVAGRLRADEDRIRAATDAMGVSTDELVDAVERRVAEVKELRARVRDLERAAAAGRSGELVAAAVDGVVVARVDGLDRDAVRDLAVAVRDHAGIRAVVLGSAPEGGGVTIVAAVTADSGFNASELIADAAKAVKGGGGKSPDLAVAGGKDPSALDAALDLARSAAGIG